MRRIFSLLLCIVLALSSVTARASSTGFLQNPDAIEEAIKSVLFVAIFGANDEITATGSGFVAFNNRTIITNYHVIEGADSIWASDEADNVYEIDKIIAVDEVKDIAILSIKGATNLAPLKLADGMKLKRGQPILTIGSPEGFKNSVSNGIISAVYDPSETPDIQFTAPISHGSSGGALFNDKGEVIGITSAFYTEGQNINFAVGIYHVIDLYRKYNSNYRKDEQIITSTPFMPAETPQLEKPSSISVKMVGSAVLVDWSEGKGARGYRVYRSTSAKSSYSLVKATSTSSYIDQNVLEGETYYYKIASSSGAAISNMSDYVMMVVPRSTATPNIEPTPANIIGPPKNVKVTVSGREAKVTWTKVTEAHFYHVYRAIAENSEYSLIGKTNTDYYIDNNTISGEMHFYKVLAERDNALSDFSFIVAIIVPMYFGTEETSRTSTPRPMPSPTPAAISYISPDETTKYKTFTVGANDPDVAKLKKRMYELGYSTSKTGNNSFTEKTAEYVREFQRINGMVVDGVASSLLQALLFSNHAKPKPTPTPKPSPTPKPTPKLTKPSGLKAKATGSSVTLTWTAVKGASKYKVYWSYSASGTFTYKGETLTTTYVDKNVYAGDVYYYKVVSNNGSNTSDRSNYVKVVMPKPTPTPYMEPKYPLDFGDDGYVGTSRDPYLNPKIVNVSDRKTVDGFTLIYYCTDVYGEKLFFDNSTDYTSIYTYTKTIKPGQSTYPGKVSLNLYGSGIKRIYVAISRIHTTDGRTYDIQDDQLNYYYWTVD
ncbi:MAG: trypsin-like peptidase domain-containing protein [Christensenellales bacterium]